jgi:ribosome-binding factor A
LELNMENRPARAPSQRQLRIGEEIRHAIAQMLERSEFHEPALHDVSVTVTEVRISPDLKNATAYIMPLGGEQADEVLEALTRARPFVRKRLGRALHLRHIPKVDFQMDATFDQASKIETLLNDPKVAQDLAVSEEFEPEEPEDHGA